MSEWNLEEENWGTLICAIQQNDCILILGPDAATEEMKGKCRPLTEILARELADEIEAEQGGKIDISDLAQVTQYYCKEKGRISLKARVADFYKKKNTLSSNFHRIIADIPFYFTVTTTHDNMLTRALKEKRKKPVVERYHFKGKNPELVTMGSGDKPLVFYLYGSVNEPNSLVLTENDLLDFLVELMSNKRPIPHNVLSELQNEDKCFLFLGVGFRYWYQRILLHVLQTRKKGSPSFALEQFIPIHKDQFRRTAFFFRWSDYRIHIFNMALDEFAVQLQEKLKQSSPDQKPPLRQEDAPEVFICHASEDKDYADWLHMELENRGLSPWLDKKNLRGGDDWNLMIKDTIKKVDYFIVLQSKALAKKHAGYVIKEINCAKDRKPEFRWGIRFIIPVIIDESQLLTELADIQSVDLRDRKDINELIDTIMRDFEKRKNL